MSPGASDDASAISKNVASGNANDVADSGANTLLIAGGGTGGHVFPALAVAQEWLRRKPQPAAEGRRVVFVGTERGIETKLVPQAGYPLELIRAAGLKGIGGMKLLRNAAMLPAGLWDSEKIIHRHRFAVGLGVGGYASGPMILAAVLHRIPDGCLRAQRRARVHKPHSGADGYARRGRSRRDG